MEAPHLASVMLYRGFMDLIPFTPLIAAAVGGIAIVLLVLATIRAVLVLTPLDAGVGNRFDATTVRKTAGPESGSTVRSDARSSVQSGALPSPVVADDSDADGNQFLELVEAQHAYEQSRGGIASGDSEYTEPSACRWWGINE